MEEEATLRKFRVHCDWSAPLLYIAISQSCVMNSLVRWVISVLRHERQTDPVVRGTIKISLTVPVAVKRQQESGILRESRQRLADSIGCMNAAGAVSMTRTEGSNS